MPDFRPSYQDYLSLGNIGGGSESGGSSAISEDAWNRLSAQDQFNMIGGGLILRPDDPRYADFKKLVGGADGRNVWITPNDLSKDPFGFQSLVDPKGQYSGQGIFAHSEDNQTPQQQGYGHKQFDPIIAALPLAFMGAGLLANGGFAGMFGGGEAAGGAAGAAAGSDVALPGALSNFATPQVGSLNLSGLSSAMNGLGLSSGGGSSFLSSLNTGRQALSGANTISRLLGGQQGGARQTNMQTNMGLGDILQLLGGGGGIGDILSLIGLGRSGGLWGNGIGTPQGAIDVGNRAADRADPWGANGRRDAFANALTPDAVDKLLHPDAASIANDPAYQFQLQEGMNAINTGDAAQGTLHSGNRLYELQKYGQGLASDFAQRQLVNNMARLNALGNLSGVNSSNPAAAGASMIGAFEGATSLQNNGLNNLLSRFMGNGSGGGGGLGRILQLLGSGGSSLAQILGGLDWNGMSQDDIWNAIGGSTNISNNLFPGGDDGGGFPWDALAGP